MSEYCGRLELEEGDLKKISNSELKSKIVTGGTLRGGGVIKEANQQLLSTTSSREK